MPIRIIIFLLNITLHNVFKMHCTFKIRTFYSKGLIQKYIAITLKLLTSNWVQCVLKLMC